MLSKSIILDAKLNIRESSLRRTSEASFFQIELFAGHSLFILKRYVPFFFFLFLKINKNTLSFVYGLSSEL